MSSCSVAFSTFENSTPWRLAFDGMDESCESTGELPATSEGSGIANCWHCSAFRPLLAPTLKNVVAEPLGNSTVASVTPPGCTKLVGTDSGSDDFWSSPPGVFSENSPGNLKETP